MSNNRNELVAIGSVIGALAGGLPGAIIGGIIGAALQEIKKCPICQNNMEVVDSPVQGKLWHCTKCNYFEPK